MRYHTILLHTLCLHLFLHNNTTQKVVDQSNNATDMCQISREAANVNAGMLSSKTKCVTRQKQANSKKL